MAKGELMGFSNLGLQELMVKQSPLCLALSTQAAEMVGQVITNRSIILSTAAGR